MLEVGHCARRICRYIYRLRNNDVLVSVLQRYLPEDASTWLGLTIQPTMLLRFFEPTPLQAILKGERFTAH